MILEIFSKICKKYPQMVKTLSRSSKLPKFIVRYNFLRFSIPRCYTYLQLILEFRFKKSEFPTRSSFLNPEIVIFNRKWLINQKLLNRFHFRILYRSRIGYISGVLFKILRTRLYRKRTVGCREIQASMLKISYSKISSRKFHDRKRSETERI